MKKNAESFFSQQLERVVTFILKRLYFIRQSMPKDAYSRREEIKSKGAEELNLENLSGFYLKANEIEKRNPIVLMALPKPFEKFLPEYYEVYLKKGADIVLWNPSEWIPKQYERDLTKVLEKVISIHPEGKIAVFARCATVDPLISVAAKLNNKNISLILDRGYGDSANFAISFTFLAKPFCVQKVIRKHFSCSGMEKITQVPGKILFITTKEPSDDQLMRYGKGRNFTHDLIAKRQNNKEVIYLENSDHWTRVGKEGQAKIDQFIFEY